MCNRQFYAFMKYVIMKYSAYHIITNMAETITHDRKQYGLNIFIDIQTSKTLIQMDINKMMKMEFIQ